MTNKPQQQPSVGRMVHYVSYGLPGGEFPAGICRAAIITQVLTVDGLERAGLCVLNPTGIFFNPSVPQDEGTHAPGTYHFPEYVPPK